MKMRTSIQLKSSKRKTPLSTQEKQTMKVSSNSTASKTPPFPISKSKRSNKSNSQVEENISRLLFPNPNKQSTLSI